MLRSEKQTFVHKVCIFIQFIHIISILHVKISVIKSRLTSLTDKKISQGMKKKIGM